MRNLYKQQGAAIIVALFVTALIAAASTAMIMRLQTDIRRTELLQNSNTAYLYAQGSIIWAIDTLNDNLAKKQEGKVIDRTPIQSPVDEESGVKIQSTLMDAQGYFNLNNLTDTTNQLNFMRLIRLVSPNIDEETAKNIVKATVDWISPATNDLALAEYYLKLTPSYRAPHRPMVSVSELRLVKGVTSELFEKLSPYITALPKQTKLNINNASELTLMTLSPNMTFDTAKKIVDAAKIAPFPSAEIFQNLDFIKNNNIDASKITVSSDYFLVLTNVKVGQQVLTLYTLLERGTKNSKPNTIQLWQSKGTL